MTRAPRNVPFVPEDLADVRCPVCASAGTLSDLIPGWGEWRVCESCTLQFANPLTRGRDPSEFFEDAYQGRLEESSLTDFHKRLGQRSVILGKLKQPPLWFWTPAFDDILAWLKDLLPPGGTVLEIGCGLGFFLHAMRDEGFDAVGLDVADVAVELNRKDGFHVWSGPIETMPIGWVEPDAVVSFFVLHHLEDPVAFLRAVRERAPKAPLAIAVYGPTNSGTPASLPPRTLIRWNARALEVALQRAGYRATTRDVRSTGFERGPLRAARLLFARTSVVPSVYRAGKALERSISSHVPARMRKPEYVVVALGEPIADAESSA